MTKLSFSQKALLEETKELRETRIELKGSQSSDHLKGLGLRVVSLPSNGDTDAVVFQAQADKRAKRAEKAKMINNAKKPLKQKITIDFNKVKVA